VKRRPARRKEEAPHPQSSGKATDLAITALLLIAIFAAYAQTLHFGFVNYDDPDYVTENPYVKSANIAWAFTHSFAGNWFPLTWLSHMLDFELFGLDAGGHHLTSVILHALATLLLFATLRRMTGSRWSSAMVAALFALHPLHVESVAWIAERKDVFSAFFWMLTLYAYVAYVERPGPTRYALTLLAFCCGLMAKPMLVTLPLVLLLLDHWPLKRGMRVVEKLPFFALSVAASVVTFVVHKEVGATASLDIFPIALRLENAPVSYAAYIIKMFWPSNLAVFYPYSRQSLAIPATFAAIGIVLVTVMARRRPYLIVGWLWYLVTLVPVIGIIQVGAQARADRYTYIPMVGLSIAVVWGLAEILAPWPRAQRILAYATCAVCAALTWSQVRYWQDGVTLFRHTVDVTTDNYAARFNLAAALDERGDRHEAATQLAEAVRIQPRFAAARAELGQLLAKQGHLPEALVQLRAAADLNPSDASTHYRLGTVLGESGSQREAAAEFQEAVRLDPDNADAHFNLGISLVNQGSIESAAKEFAATAKLRPDDPYAHFNLGISFARLGRISEAIVELTKTVQLDPRLPGAREALNRAIEVQSGK
jgi:Flp pilus assembly protein TadD